MCQSHTKPVLEAHTIEMYPYSMRYPPHTPSNEKTFGKMLGIMGFSVAKAKRNFKVLVLAILVGVAVKGGYLDTPISLVKNLVSSYWG